MPALCRLSKLRANLQEVMPGNGKLELALSTPGCVARAAPATGPSPVMMLMTPGGIPASSAISPTLSALSGVCSATWHIGNQDERFLAMGSSMEVILMTN